MDDTSQARALVGTWTLASIQFEFDDNTDRVDIYGPSPVGQLIATEDGRIMVLITASDRSPPKDDADGAPLFKTMMSYAGKYRIDGDRFITTIEIAWHPGWVKTDQLRTFHVKDDRLSIITGPQTHPMFGARTGKGVIVWNRA